MPKKNIDEVPTRFTDFDQVILRGLCRQPWANDREVADAEKVVLSTVTASKNRMKRNRVIQRAYIPSYYRLGYPLVSFSKLKLNSTKNIDFKVLLKNNNDEMKVPFLVHDPLNAFMISYHSTYSDYKTFERQFDDEWNHELFALEGSTCLLNFNFTNTINKVFFPKDLESNRSMKIDTIPYNFKMKIHRTIFKGLLENPEKAAIDLVKPLGITRQSITKVRKLFKAKGILDRTTIIDLEMLGINLLSIIKFHAETTSDKDIFAINNAMRPFYYWVFDKVHILLVGDVDYHDLMKELEELSSIKSVSNIDIQTFDVIGAKMDFMM